MLKMFVSSTNTSA